MQCILRVGAILLCSSGAMVVLASTAGTGMRGEGQIAFVSDRNRDGSQIFALDIQRGITLNLTPKLSHTFEPDWSPDGQYLLFFMPVGSPSDLFIMRANGRDLRAVNLGQEHRSGSWSPDGTRVIFQQVIRVVEINVPVSHFQLQIMNLINGEVRDLPSHSPRDMHADWSPDGQYILFQAVIDNNDDLYLMDGDGGNLRRLTDHPATDQSPSWSPDGEHIAFVSDRDGNREIYTLELSTLEVRRLTDYDGIDGSPAWSPDGEHIVFLSDRDKNFDLYLMDADGSNLRRLTHHPAADLMPVWWP
jgi:TolB protein